jgi:type I restriction enzyme, S subunit
VTAVGKTKASWQRVTLGDCCDEVAERVNDPAHSGFDRFVGLEHLESGETTVRTWGSTIDVESSMKLFKPEDVLVARRNVYLRRAARAEFSGVCSGDAIVLRPRSGPCLAELLSFIVSTDAFWEYVASQADGTMSKRVTVERLLQFEFALPPLNEQARISRALRAGEVHSQALRRLSRATASLLQATIDEAFFGHIGDSSLYAPRAATIIGDLPATWRLHPLADVCSKIVDGVHKKPNYVDLGVPFLTVENLNRGPSIDFSDTRFVTTEDHHEFCKRTKPEQGDVLVSKDGTLGVARVVETNRAFSIFVSIALLKPKRDQLDPWFLRYYFDSTLFKHRLAGKVSGSALKHIHLVDFRESIIPVPPLPEQEMIVDTIGAVDRSHRHCLLEEGEARDLRQVCCAGLLSGVPNDIQ